MAELWCGPGISYSSPAVVPVLIGPLQALLAILPGLAAAAGAALLAMFKPSALKKFCLLLWAQKIPLLAAGGAIAAAVHFYPALFPPVVEQTAAREEGGGWSLFRGTPTRRGAILDDKFEEAGHGGVRWAFKGGFQTYYASPAVVGNRIYIASAEYNHFRNRGSVFSLDADSGKVVWKFSARNFRATYSSPSAAGKYLVSGEGLHYTTDARVFCLDVERSEQERRGVVLWEYRTRSHVESSPCVDLQHGRVYIGAGDDGWYCFKLEPDAAGKAQVVWHLPGKEYPDAETSPVLAAGRLYFGLGLGGRAVCCVDPATGKKIWRKAMPYPAFGSPAVADGRVFVGMGNGNMIESAEVARAKEMDKRRAAGASRQELAKAAAELAPGGAVRCLDAKTGKQLWEHKLARGVLAPPVVADGRVYFGARDKFLYCLSAADGKLVKRWNARVSIVTAPAVARQTVYVVTTDDGRLHALDRKTLKPFWELTLGTTQNAFLSSPVSARGHVYVGTGDDGFLCVGEPGRRRAVPVWAGRLGGPERGGRADDEPLPVRGRYAWRFPKTTAAAAAAAAGTGAGATTEKNGVGTGTGAAPLPAGVPEIRTPPAVVGNVFYVGLNYKEKRGLAELKLGPRPRRKPSLGWFASTKNPVYESAAAAGEVVYFVDGRPGDAERALRCLNRKTGKELWRRPVERDATGALLLSGKRLFVADGAADFSCLEVSGSRKEGRLLWKSQLGRPVGAPTPAGDLVFVALVSSPPASAPPQPRLAALDALTGVPLWTAPTAGRPLSAPLVVAGGVWLNTGAGVEIYDLVSGRRVAVVPSSAETAPAASSASLPATAPAAIPPATGLRDMVRDDEQVACITAAGELAVFSARLGRYRVYVRRPVELRDEGKTLYMVLQAGGKTPVELDTDGVEKAPRGGNRWETLGVFNFDADEGAMVEVTTDYGRATAAAVKFVPVIVDPATKKDREEPAGAVVIFADDPLRVSRQGKWKQGASLKKEGGGYTPAFICDEEATGAFFRWKTVLPPTGVELLRKSGASPEITPVLCGGKLLYFAGKAFRVYDFDKGKSVRWLKWLRTWGRPTSPAVLFDSRVFFAAEKRGLLCAAKKH